MLHTPQRQGWTRPSRLTETLTDITTIGVPAADELPEDQLFEHLLAIGRERRAASQRLAAVREGLK